MCNKIPVLKSPLYLGRNDLLGVKNKDLSEKQVVLICKNDILTVKKVIIDLLSAIVTPLFVGRRASFFYQKSKHGGNC